MPATGNRRALTRRLNQLMLFTGGNNCGKSGLDWGWTSFDERRCGSSDRWKLTSSKNPNMAKWGLVFHR
jgi:hypothetical protein